MATLSNEDREFIASELAEKTFAEYRREAREVCRDYLRISALQAAAENRLALIKRLGPYQVECGNSASDAEAMTHCIQLYDALIEALEEEAMENHASMEAQ